MPDFVNLSVYKFTPLGDLPALRERLLTRTNKLQLKGTILLSPRVSISSSPARVNRPMPW
jgi:predicted sulfurtransferase